MSRAVRALGAAVLVTAIAGSPGTPATARIGTDGSPSARTLTQRIDEGLDRVRAELGGEPDDARAWVADHIAPERYDGVLKGARGAYLTGRGNSADQALLLADLLQDAGVDTRFATCATTAETPDDDRPPAIELDRAESIATHVSDPGLRAAILALPRRFAEQRRTTQRDAIELAEALALVPFPPWAPPEPAPEEPKPHVWVQMGVSDSWSDLDPSTSTGQAPCEAAETFDALPETMFQRVRISLVLEQWMGEALTRPVALTAEFATADLATAHIAFGFAEPLGLQGRAPESPTSLRTYTPVLDVDGALTVGTPIELPGSDPDREVDPVSAAWLALELISPDGKSTKLASEVFDRINTAVRVSGYAARRWVTPLEQIDGEYPALGALWEVGLLLGPNQAAEAAMDGSADVTTLDGISGLLDGLLRMFPAVQRDLGGEAAVPSVVVVGLVPAVSPDGRPGVRTVFDVLSVPGPKPVDADAAARDAEAILGAEATLADLLGTPAGVLDDARSVFNAARRGAIPLLVITPADEPAIEGASADAIAGITARLYDGFRILTPARVPTVDGVSTTAWWLIDSRSSLVRDEHENGRHGADAFTASAGHNLTSLERFRQVASRLASPAVVAASMLFTSAGGPMPVLVAGLGPGSNR